VEWRDGLARSRDLPSATALRWPTNLRRSSSLAGRKRATCWAASEGMLSEVGKRMVMLDGSGRPRAVLETLEITRHRFDQVDAAFAYDEGEGDRTLAFWR
jgi:uncharacterized protein YhfF